MTWRGSQRAILALAASACVAWPNAATAQTNLCDGSALPAGSAPNGSFCVPLGIGSTSPATGTLLTLGASGGGINGAIAFNGATSGEVLLTVGSATGNAVKFQLPSSNGTSGYVLQTDGTGVTSWGTVSATGTLALGTSASVTNPARSGEVTTGLFSPASGAIGFASLGTEQMRITPGRVGIGTSSPLEPLQIRETINSASANSIGYYAAFQDENQTVYPGVIAQITTPQDTTFSSQVDGILGWSDAPSSNSSNVADVTGVQGLATIESTVANNWGGAGVDGEIYLNGNITPSQAYISGIFANAEQDSGTNASGVAGGTFLSAVTAGTVSNGLYGIVADPDVYGGTVTNGITGIYVEPDIDGGTVDTRVGVFIAQGAGAPTSGDWGIYEESTAQNYFGGNVGIGTTIPSSSFEIVDGASSDNDILMGSNGGGSEISFDGNFESDIGIGASDDSLNLFTPTGDIQIYPDYDNDSTPTFIFTGTGLGIGSTTPIAPLNVQAALTSSSGYVTYYNAFNGANSTEFPGVLAQITAVSQADSYPSTDSIMGWIDVPSSNAGPAYAQGIMGLLTMEDIATPSWAAPPSTAKLT